MKSNIIALLFLLAGIMTSTGHVYAVVIKTPDELQNNYEIHHRVIVYNDLTSYQNINGAQDDIKNNLVEQNLLSKDNLDISQSNMEQAPVNENPIKELRLRSSYNAETSTQKYNNLTQNNSIANEIEETAVGSFLDSFKDDPLMKTIYFTSRDLTFSYQKKIANLFQLGFDMEPSEYEKYMASLYENSEEPKIEYSDQEKNIMKEEASNLFRLISEYFSTILYFLAGMIGALYLFIRYILIKYI